MAILKSEIRNKFSTIPNSVIRAKDVSDGDYRLMIYLYSLPNGWRVNQSYLASELKCNLRNVNAKIKRLKDAGYLEIVRASKNNMSDYIYILKEKDMSVSDASVSNASINNASINDAHINNNIINTDLINNDINISTTTRANFIAYVEKTFNRILNGEEQNYFSKIDINYLTLYAIREAGKQNKLNIKYIEKIIKDCQEKGITTMEQLSQREKDFESQKHTYQRKMEKPPDWFNKKIVEEKLSADEEKELINILKDFE